jgi:molecular chaperone GrpE
MSHPEFTSKISDGPPQLPAEHANPQFGLIDVIEAFTAMRHEWRGQTQETRQLAESVQSTAANLEILQTRLASLSDEQANDESRKLAESLVELDHQLTRAVEVFRNVEARRAVDQARRIERLQAEFQRHSLITRWFARPVLNSALQELDVSGNEQSADNTANEGLTLLLGKLRTLLKQHHIERIETTGRPFDAATMHAIGAVADSSQPSGNVAEQLAPCYFWQGRLLRCAQVQVAR